jgi:hypothetical protein
VQEVKWDKRGEVSILSFFHSCILDKKIDHVSTIVCYIDCHRQHLCKRWLIDWTYRAFAFIYVYRFNVNHNDPLVLILIKIHLWRMGKRFNMLVVRFICIEYQENIGQIDLNECGLRDWMLFKRELSNWFLEINNND